jgi:hypothetical protein
MGMVVDEVSGIGNRDELSHKSPSNGLEIRRAVNLLFR